MCPMQPRMEDLKPGRRLGRFRLVRELGRGAAGLVFFAQDEHTGHIIAVKVLHPALASNSEALERFQREVALARRIVHPNVCRVYDLHVDEGFRFLPGVAIDQQFTQRNRLNDMLELKKSHPAVLGLGIDENTAVIVQGREMEVVGKHQVAVFDRAIEAENTKRAYETLAAGDRYDLVSRQRLEPTLAEAGSESPKVEVRPVSVQD